MRALQALLLAGGSLIAFGASPALAQSAAAPATTDGAAAPDSVEDVVVTARRHEERLQDVPVAVTALSGEQMEARAMTDLRDVARFTPNVYMSNFGAQSPDQISMFIRGVGLSDSFATSDPGVGLYVDGVYYSRPQGGILDLVDLERIEVLRGPQGTLFGKGTAGGAINVVSRAPTGDGGGMVSLTAGNLGQLEAAGRADIGLMDNLALGISVLSKHRDCLAHRATDDACYGSIDRLSGRAFLRWTPTDALTVDLIADQTDGDSTSRPHHPVGYDLNSGFIGLYNGVFVGSVPGGQPFTLDNPGVNPGRYAVGGSSPTSVPLEAHGLSLQVAYRLPFATLHSITAYRDVSAPSFEDSVGNPNTGPFSPGQVYSFSSSSWWSQELRIDGSTLGDRLEYVAGLYYFREDGTTNEGLNIFPPNPLGSVDFNTQIQESSAAFAHLSYALTDRMHISAGMRYSEESKDWTFKNVTLASLVTPTFNPAIDFGSVFRGDIAAYPNALNADPTSTAFTHETSSWNPITWQVGVDYKLADNLLVFANAGRGFRSGGFNGRATTFTAVQPFDPEYTTSYEVGFKSDLLDRHLRFNATAFYTDYQDLQQSILTCVRDATGDCALDPVSGAPTFAPIVANAANATLYGGEAELAWVDGPLRVDANLGYIHAQFDEVDPAATVSTGLSTDSTLPYVPEWTASLGVQYEFDLGPGTLTPRVDYSYRSTVAFNPNPGPFGKQGPVSLVNATLTYAPNDSRWSLALYARNLFDEKYDLWDNEYAKTGVSATGALVEPADPREWGVRVTRSF